MKPCNEMNFHPAAQYYCPNNNSPQKNAPNPIAVDYAYGIKPKKGGNKNCITNKSPSLSEDAWDNRYEKLFVQNGGGYYLEVAKPPIGGKAALGTYPNCCPPVFCGNLTGGTKRMNKYNRIGYGIFETDKLLSHLKKNNLSEIINKLSLNNNKTLKEYHKYFDKNVLRTLASTLLLDTYINSKNKVDYKDHIKSLNNIIKKDYKLRSLLSYLEEVIVKKKDLKKLHQKGGYSSTLYPLGYYISPIGANMFTAAAILFFMNMLYKFKSNDNKLFGGVKLNKKEIVEKIKDLVKSIHNFKFTKKNIEKLGNVSFEVKKKVKINKKRAKKYFKGKGGSAPIDYVERQLLEYNCNLSKELEKTQLSQENVGDFLKKNNIMAGI